MSNTKCPPKRVLPKLMACMTRTSLENLRSKALFSLNVLDAKGIRRRKMPLHECLILELQESGFIESSHYLSDLLYDNAQLMAADEIGIVVDLKKREDYLEYISSGLQKAERERDRGHSKPESKQLLKLAMYFAEQGKGILWLAEKFFLASVAVSSQYLLDGGAQKCRCKSHYATFLLDKWSDVEEAFQILTDVRDSSIGKDWPLYEPEKNEVVSDVTVFIATAVQLHRVLLAKSRQVRKSDTGKSERLARLAERRAQDAGESAKMAEAIIEIGICQLMMNNLNNAQKTLERAYKIHHESNNIAGICETKMHQAAVMQKLGDHETAAKLLTEMGALAMENSFRRQLGRALHLLGELHLRRERPELGTQHLAEAFTCFMGYGFEPKSPKVINTNIEASKLDVIMNIQDIEIYIEEAEQSRLMMAISAGQELMPSYFEMLRDAHECNVAQLKTIEWKLSKAGWWVHRHHHDMLPCMCPVHHRTPLDCLWIALEYKKTLDAIDQSSLAFISTVQLGRTDTTSDITKLHSIGASAFRSYIDTTGDEEQNKLSS